MSVNENYILFEELFKQIKNVVHCDDSVIPLHAPEFSNIEIGYVSKCIESGWVSSVGESVVNFEKKLCERLGCKHAVAMSNGTSALQIALISCGINTGDEVLVPALTFVATPNAVMHAGAIPHFIDSEFSTLGVCPDSLRKHLESTTFKSKGVTYNKHSGNAISAIIPMHTFGHPVDMDPIIVIAEEFNLKIVEDAAEALGSKYKSKQCGTLGDVGMLSFNGNKIITTGGGGALVSDNSLIAERARHLSTTAKLKHNFEFEHDEIGFNFRMPNLNAALGCAQITKLDNFLLKKRELFLSYEKIFFGHPLASLFAEPKNAESNYWLNCMIIDKKISADRDEILKLAINLGIQCRPAWKLMPSLPMFQDCPTAEIKNSQEIVARLINIPSGPGLVK